MQPLVTGAEVQGSSIAVKLSSQESIEYHAILAATGRELQSGPLRLDGAGLRADQNGIVIDKRRRTSVPHICAVGDAAGRYQLTHRAEHLARVVITNCILRWPASINERYVAWRTFTSPEMDHIGRNEHDLEIRRISVLRFPFGMTDRALIDGGTDGMVKLIAEGRGRILGASVLGLRGRELITTWSLAMRKGLRGSDVSATIHPYPTYALANRRAAGRSNERRLDSPLLALLGRVCRYVGTRKGSSVP